LWVRVFVGGGGCGIFGGHLGLPSFLVGGCDHGEGWGGFFLLCGLGWWGGSLFLSGGSAFFFLNGGGGRFVGWGWFFCSLLVFGVFGWGVGVLLFFGFFLPLVNGGSGFGPVPLEVWSWPNPLLVEFGFVVVGFLVVELGSPDGGLRGACGGTPVIFSLRGVFLWGSDLLIPEDRDVGRKRALPPRKTRVLLRGVEIPGARSLDRNKPPKEKKKKPGKDLGL